MPAALTDVAAEAVQLVVDLRAAIDRLQALPVDALDADELHALVVAAHTQRTRFTLALAGVQAAWVARGAWQADGSLSPALALARDTHHDHVRMRDELRRARRLQGMPATREALDSGRLSWDHVELLLRHATPARWPLFVEHEQVLVDQLAGCLLFDDARQIVRYWAQLADDELGLQRHPTDPSTVYLSRTDEGEAIIDGRLAPIDAEIVDRELRRLVREVRAADTRNGVERTPAQRRAAALVAMAQRSMNATGLAPRPLFEVIVGDETARRLCQLSSGHVVHPDDLVPYLDDATFETFLFDGPSTIVGVSKQRTFRGALRRAIKVRDRRCQHPSVCPASIDDCDIDHCVPASEHGPTSQFNARAGCVPHNRLHHLRGQAEARTERPLDRLDELRCRLRWRLRREHPEQLEGVPWPPGFEVHAIYDHLHQHDGGPVTGLRQRGR